MKSNRSLFLLVAALLLTACDAGKYYAKKKINRHYEELAHNEVTTPADQPIITIEEKEISSAPVTLLTEEKNTDAPAISSPQARPGIQKRNTNAEQMQQNTHKAQHSFAPDLKPVLKELNSVKKQAGEKSVGTGLVMILVALLLLLLGVLFAAVLGDLGLVFAIIFWIGAVVLVVAGIITMFINN